MSNSKPLTYESLRTVLQHIDANLRFQLASHVPSIRTLEKIVPLKIQSFKYESGTFEVNKMRYSISLYQKSKTGETPEKILEENEKGYKNYDIDQFGFRDKSAEEVVLPGDIAFQEQTELLRHRADFRVHVREENTENRINRLEMRLDQHKTRLAKLQALNISEIEHMDIHATANQHLYNEYYNIFMGRTNFDNLLFKQLKKLEVRAARTDVMRYLKFQIKQMQGDLQPYYHQRGDSPYPYNTYAQLLIFSSKYVVVKHELIEYTAKLPQVVKYLCNFLLGNRKSVVYVKRLAIECYQIMRLPMGLKIKIRELKFVGNMGPMYESLKPLVDESSYPLEVIETSVCQRRQEDFMNPVIQNAKKLIIGYWILEEGTWLSLYKNLQNPVVHKRYEKESLPIEDYIQLIDHWLENGRETGTCFTVRIEKEEIITALLELATEQLVGAVAGEKCVTIPMNTFSQVQLSYTREDISHIPPHFKVTPGWILKIAVIPIA